MSARKRTLSDFIMKTEWEGFGPMINYWVELQRQGVPLGGYYERAARCFECDERIKDDELAEIRNIPMTADEELECFDGILCPLDYLESLLSKLAGIDPVDRTISWGIWDEIGQAQDQVPRSAVPISQGPTPPARPSARSAGR